MRKEEYMLTVRTKKMTKLFLTFFIFLISCKDYPLQEDAKLDKKGYKGHAMFYYYNRSQDGYRELFFIPVSNPQSLIDLKNIDASIGYSFVSNGNEKFIKNVFDRSVKIKLHGRQDENVSLQFIYYTPVYVEYDFKVDSHQTHLKKYSYNDYLIFNKTDTLKVDYHPTQKNITDVIIIKKLDIVELSPADAIVPLVRSNKRETR